MVLALIVAVISEVSVPPPCCCGGPLSTRSLWVCSGGRHRGVIDFPLFSARQPFLGSAIKTN